MAMAVAYPKIENAINDEIAVTVRTKVTASILVLNKDVDPDNGNASTVIAFHWQASVMADLIVGINQMNAIVVSI